MDRVSFPISSFSYDESLDKFFGSSVIAAQAKVRYLLGGLDGIYSITDEYRSWLMQVLQKEGFSKFEDAYEKYPFLKIQKQIYENESDSPGETDNDDNPTDEQ